MVTLDGQAAENALAMLVHGLLAENLHGSAPKRQAFRSIRSTFALIAPDAEVSVTLAFEDGGCTLYDGIRGEPDLVITADSARIPELSLLSVRCGLPWLLDEAGQALARALYRREIRIEGLVRLPPAPLRSARAALDLVRLTRVLSLGV